MVRISEYSKKYYQENKEKIMKQQKEYRQKNIEKRREWIRNEGKRVRLQRNLYKSVLDEIRECIETKLRDVNLTYGIDNEFRQEYDDLLQILDKVKK